MERPAKSALTKWSKQKSNKRRRRANFRFFAKFRRNKYNIPRDVGANVVKDPTHGGKFGSNRDSASGIVHAEVGMHKKITHNKLPREVGAVPRRTNVDKDPAHGATLGTNSNSTSKKVVLVQESLSLLWAYAKNIIVVFLFIHSFIHSFN